MRLLGIAAAALLLIALAAYAAGLGVYAYASTKPAIATQPRNAREARDTIERMGLARAYPFSHRFALTPHGRMHYLDEGAGPALLLLHGNGSWSLAWVDEVRERAARARVIAPDLIGFGLSEKPVPPVGDPLDAHTADLAALLDVLDLRDVEIVAAASAAALAERLAANEKARVRSVSVEGVPAKPLAANLARVPVLGEVLVQGVGALSPGLARSAVGRAQGSWDERAASLAWARATAP